MKILHVNFAKGFRGGERQTAALIGALAEHSDVKQSLLVRRGSELPKYLDQVANLTIIAVSKPYLSAAWSLSGFDWVHAHEAKAVKWAYWYRRFKNTPYLVTRRIIKSPSSNLLTKRAYAGAKHLVAISHYVQQVMQGYLAHNNVSVIPDSTSALPQSPAKIESLKQRFRGKRLIGHVGALVDADKGQSTIIAAAEAARETRPEYHFVLLGDGADAEWLKESSAHLANVEFVGFQEDVGSWLAVMDCFVFPSRQEGLGSSILDANAGVPVIATDVGGIPDLVKHEVTGLLIPADNALELSRSIVRLEEDKALQERCVQGAEGLIRDFTPQAVAERYLALYRA